MTRVYFAHSTRDYGHVDSVAADIAATFNQYEVVNPEKIGWEALQKRLGSCEAVYQHVIDISSFVVVLEHEGHIGRGVYEEVRLAMTQGKPVYAIRDGWLWSAVAAIVKDESDWKVKYAQLRVEDYATLKMQRAGG